MIICSSALFTGMWFWINVLIRKGRSGKDWRKCLMLSCVCGGLWQRMVGGWGWWISKPSKIWLSYNSSSTKLSKFPTPPSWTKSSASSPSASSTSTAPSRPKNATHSVKTVEMKKGSTNAVDSSSVPNVQREKVKEVVRFVTRSWRWVRFHWRQWRLNRREGFMSPCFRSWGWRRGLSWWIWLSAILTTIDGFLLLLTFIIFYLGFWDNISIFWIRSNHSFITLNKKSA